MNFKGIKKSDELEALIEYLAAQLKSINFQFFTRLYNVFALSFIIS